MPAPPASHIWLLIACQWHRDGAPERDLHRASQRRFHGTFNRNHIAIIIVPTIMDVDMHMDFLDNAALTAACDADAPIG
jgi:hypothetical protein